MQNRSSETPRVTHPAMSLSIRLLFGKPLVYDKTMQLDGSPHVFLWNYEARRMDSYVPDMVRPNLTPFDEGLDRGKIEAAYREWLADESSTWRNEQKSYYGARIAAARAEEERIEVAAEARMEGLRDIESRHKRHLAEHGVPYSGVSKYRGARRIAHCWSCHSTLDSSSDLACNRCRWLVCLCGACGCAAPTRRDAVNY